MEKEQTPDSFKQEKLTEEELNALRSEIAELKAAKGHDIHFDSINPDELTDEDLEIFGKFKNKTLKRGEFKMWSKTAIKGSARFYFYGWINNRLNERENIKWYDPISYEKVYSPFRE